MLQTLLILLYVIVSVFLILVVLLQTGKRADLAGAFGGGGSQTALGTRGAASLLTKMTTVSAVLFMVLALSLSILSSRRAGTNRSVLDEVPVSEGGAPATPVLPEGSVATEPVPPATDAGAPDGDNANPVAPAGDAGEPAPVEGADPTPADPN